MFYPGIGEQQQGWLGRLSAFLPGAEQMSDQERRALITQGLLAMGAGILKNNSGNYGKAGPAIGAGISEGLLAMNKGADNLSEQKYRQQVMERQMGDPAGVREFNMMTQGLSDDERERARRIALGLEGRASNAGYGFDMVTDGSGIPRPQRMNPRTGTIEQYASEIGQWVPLDGAAPQQAAPNPRADFLGMADQFGAQITSLYRSPEHNSAVGGVPNSQHMKGTAGDFVVPPQAKPQFIAEAKARGYEAIDEGDHVHLELPTFKPAPIPGLGRGRRKEDEAGAVAAAQKAVELGALPAELQMRTNAAIEQARGTAQAGVDVERQAEAPKRIARNQQALATAGNVEKSIDNAMRLVGPRTTGFVGARLRGIEGTDAFNLASELETIKSNLGFDRLQQMRESSPTGGALGQVAVQELNALQATVSNLDPNQSEEQIRRNIERVRKHYDNWKKVVQQALTQDQASAGQGAAAGGVRRYNPATGKIE